MSIPSPAVHRKAIYERMRETTKGPSGKPRNHMCYCDAKSSGHIAGYDSCGAPRGTQYIEPRCKNCGATNFVTIGAQSQLFVRYRCTVCGGNDIQEDASCQQQLDPITLDQLLYDTGHRD